MASGESRPPHEPPDAAEQSEFEAALARAARREADVEEKSFVEGKPVAWYPQGKSQLLFMACPLFEALVHGTRGGGKDIAVDTPVLTQRGWVPAGDITYDDRLVAIDGSYTGILGIYPKRDREMFRIEFYDGASIVADRDHRWLTLNGKTGYREGGWKVRTTGQMAGMTVPLSVPFMRGPVGGRNWRGPDPYMVGLLLGDGTMRSARVTLYSADEEILEFAASLGWNRYAYGDQIGRACCPEADAGAWRAVLPAVKAPNKSVPAELLGSDPASRLAVLQGLMDTDGSASIEGKCRFDSTSEALARAVHDLAWSLGGAASVTRQERAVVSRGGKVMWRTSLRHNNRFAPFRLRRKLDRLRVQSKFLTRGIRSIEPAGRGNGVCFAVDHPERCFVIKDWVVTHNTDALLMSFAQYVGRGWGPAWTGAIFRQTYPQLADLVAKSLRWFRRMFPRARFVQGGNQGMRWVFPEGETLLFRYLRVPDDYWNYHGHELPFLGFEELTNWPDPRCYTSMFACCRSSHPNVPRMVRATTNPYGVGHEWVKHRFRLHSSRAWARAGSTVLVTDSKDEDTDELEPARVAIHSRMEENEILMRADPNYRQTITAAATNEAMRAAWLGGRWDIVAGGMFADVWSQEHNAVPRFHVPPSWRIDRAFDWGSAKPFSVGWYALSDGTDLVLPDGRVRSTVRGDLFRIAEWYGWTGRPNQGKHTLAVDVARGIVERELLWGWRKTGDPRWCRVLAGPADSSIFSVENGTSIAGDMERPVRVGNLVYPGVSWTPADKRSGSRKAGWEQMRAMIAAARRPEGGGPREAPGLFVCDEACPQWIRTVLSLPRDEKDLDDVDTDAEDHCLAGETLVVTSEGCVPIAEMPERGVVLTPFGWSEYENCGLKFERAECVDAGGLVCTPDHEILGPRGWLAALETADETGYRVCLCGFEWSPGRSRSSAESGSTAAGATSSTRGGGFTGRSGRAGTALSQRGTRSITSTATRRTTDSGTCASCRGLLTLPFTEPSETCRRPPRMRAGRRPNGTAPRRGGAGTESTTARWQALPWRTASEWSARTAERRSGACPDGLASARTDARPQPDGRAAWTTKSATARTVGRASGSAGTTRIGTARGPAPAGRRDVYCLSVPGIGAFVLASGLIVANCGDETRYRVRASGAVLRQGKTVGMTPGGGVAS